MKTNRAVEFIIPVHPSGTNSTMFTECCEVAICDHELNCPHCGKPVIGYDAKTNASRGRIRWQNATRYWNRKEIHEIKDDEQRYRESKA